MSLDPWIIWTIVGFGLLIAELCTGTVYLLCFSVGAFAAAVVTLAGGGAEYQIAFFCTGSAALFFGARPIILRWLQPPCEARKTNVDALIGKKGQVTEALDPVQRTGRVLLGGEDWRAVSDPPEKINAGVEVVVVNAQGATLIVRRA